MLVIKLPLKFFPLRLVCVGEGKTSMGSEAGAEALFLLR